MKTIGQAFEQATTNGFRILRIGERVHANDEVYNVDTRQWDRVWSTWIGYCHVYSQGLIRRDTLA